jgi:hypothetical protein
VKYFKNSQQIDYGTYRDNSYTDRERNSPDFLKEKYAYIIAMTCRQERLVSNMAFSKREQSFCVLEYARTSSVVTVLAANQGNYVH